MRGVDEASQVVMSAEGEAAFVLLGPSLKPGQSATAEDWSLRTLKYSSYPLGFCGPLQRFANDANGATLALDRFPYTSSRDGSGRRNVKHAIPNG